MTPSRFEDLVLASVQGTVLGKLGVDAWKALNFYFDVRKVANSPETFTRLLGNLFGGRASDIEKMIVKDLLVRAGLPVPPVLESTRIDDFYSGNVKPKASEFQDWIRRAREKFASSQYSTMA